MEVPSAGNTGILKTNMLLQDSAILSNLDVQGILRTGNLFEKQYIRARTKENRVYDDREVSSLPDMLATHEHYAEWMLRKRSSERLIKRLASKRKPQNILEIGCGNGWLSHRLSGIKNATVTGQDINFTELQQAARVFNGQRKLRFVYGDVFSGILKERKFDVIVFAASIHYFHSLNKILAFAIDRLDPGGEIHILDTHFYKAGEIREAANRTAVYYRELGFPEMADHYFHHSTNDLSLFRHRVLYDPRGWVNRLLGRKQAFPWICLKKDK